MVKTLQEAIQTGKRLAIDELMGASEPFTAIHWMKTLPKEWQPAVEDAIVVIYHKT